MIRISVNGKAHKLDMDPGTPLLWALRDGLQLTGTRYGCGISRCGACIVLLDDAPVRSCVTPLSAVAGKTVTTIEGLSADRSHPVQSAIVYDLTATLKGAITVAGGRVVQDNFDDYPLLRIDECPEIAVHIVDSDKDPGGIGEPGVPPTAPAVANAVFALTGKPVRTLPIRLDS